MTKYVDEGIKALRNKDKTTALRLLSTAVKQDPRDERAWLALAATVDKKEQRIFCLKKVLALNPNNAVAKRELLKNTSHSTRATPNNFRKKSVSKKTIAISGIAVLVCICIVIITFGVVGQQIEPAISQVTIAPNQNTATLQPTTTLEVATPTMTPNISVSDTHLPSLTETRILIPTDTVVVGDSTAMPMNQPSQTAPYPCVPLTLPITGYVKSIVDGDTIIVNFDGNEFRVRYIGIDTPETGQPYSGEAAAINQQLVRGQQATLYKDVSETDQYGRLLRYVFIGDTFVNYELVVRGYAKATDYPPDSACKGIFADAETYAKTNQLGMWRPTQEASPQSAVCSCSGDVYNCDITDFASRSQAQSCFNYCKSQGVGDVHELDRDNDGIACESLP